MKTNGEHTDLDRFLREKFEGHTIEPAEELWKGIEQRFAPQVVSLHKYSLLKLALYSSVAVIAGLVVLIVMLKTENPNVANEKLNEIVNENSAPLTVSETQNPEDKAIESAVPENKAVFTEIRKTSVQHKRFQESENEILQPERFQERNSDFECLPIQPIAVGEIWFDNKTSKLKLKTSDVEPIIAVASKNIKPVPSQNKNRRNFRSKPRYISAEKFYAKNSKSRHSGKAGNFWKDFDLRANLSPTFNTRSLNNLQNTTAIDYSPAFYNEIEKGRITLNGGLELAFHFNPNWSVYSGVKLSRYSQHIQTIKNQYKIVSANQITVPASAGNIGLNGTGIGQLAFQSEVGTYLKLQYIDVPLVARYKMSGRFYFDAGVKYSYLFSDKTTGKIMDSDTKIQVDKITGLQKNNFGFIFGAGMEHTTRSGFRYELGPEISLNLTNINPTASIIGKPVFLGFRTSIYFAKYKRM